MHIHKYQKTTLIILLLSAAVAGGCNKSDLKPAAPVPPGYYGRQAFIFPLNANFIIYDTAMKLTGLVDTLAQAGPYTTFLPDNNAIGWGAVAPSGQFYYLQVPSNARTILLSLIFPGAHYLDSLPAVTNQVWISLAGTRTYISKYVVPDTTYTINGVPVYTPDFPSTNGPIQVLDKKIPNIESYPTITAYVNATPELTYLAVALQRSGLSKMLSDTAGAWTLLAPGNTAFTNSPDSSFNTLDSLLKADTAKLANLIRFHILPGRNFLYDLNRLPVTLTDTVRLPTLYSGEQLSLLFADQNGNPGNYFYGYGDSTSQYNYNAGMYYNVPSAVGLYSPDYGYTLFADRPVGNGVVHELGALLIP